MTVSTLPVQPHDLVQRTRFLGVDELDLELTTLAGSDESIASVRTLGASRRGHPLRALRVEGGPQHAIVFAMPHPNEPIGALTVLELAALLISDDELRDALGYTWHLLPCIDPDGTRLNERWFAGPFSHLLQARHLYRPPFDRQVEWTFPIDGGPPPLAETRALMTLIDETRPAFMASLHNGNHGGSFHYVSEPLPGLYPRVVEIADALGTPLHVGEPEIPQTRLLAPGVYWLPAAEELRKIFQEEGGPASSIGASSRDYAARFGTFTIHPETPLCPSWAATDESPAGVTRREALARAATSFCELTDWLGETHALLAPVLRSPSPFNAVVQELMSAIPEHGAGLNHQAERAGGEPATVAQCFSLRELELTVRLRATGQLLRLLEDERAAGNDAEPIETMLGEAAARLEQVAEEADRDLPTTVDIARLVAEQLAVVVAAADEVRRARAQ